MMPLTLARVSHDNSNNNRWALSSEQVPTYIPIIRYLLIIIWRARIASVSCSSECVRRRPSGYDTTRRPEDAPARPPPTKCWVYLRAGPALNPPTATTTPPPTPPPPLRTTTTTTNYHDDQWLILRPRSVSLRLTITAVRVHRASLPYNIIHTR